MNVRALHVVVLELICGLVDEMVGYDDFIFFLDSSAIRNYLAKHSIIKLIKPCQIIMPKIICPSWMRSKFALYLYAFKQVLPYYFAEFHWNYARDGLAYKQTIQKLPNSFLESFMKGEHVVYLEKDFWNGIWSDMSIKVAYMKISKGPEGLIG